MNKPYLDVIDFMKIRKIIEDYTGNNLPIDEIRAMIAEINETCKEQEVQTSMVSNPVFKMGKEIKELKLQIEARDTIIVDMINRIEKLTKEKTERGIDT